MAKTINPSKLLPSAKSTAIIKIGQPKPINFITKTSSLSKGLLAKRENKDPIDANNKLVKVDKFLKSDLIVSKKKAEVKRKDKEKQDFAEAEKKLETPQSKKFKLPGISVPSLGFMDRVKRFIFFTALGWALPKILEFLPKLEGFAKIVGGVYQFAEGLFGKLFDGFMSLVKFGGDLKDKTLGFIAQVSGGDAKGFEKKFSELEKQFNNFANLSIIAGLVGLDMGIAAVDEYNKWKRKSEGAAGAGGRKLAAEFLERKLGRKLTPQELKELGVKPGSVEGRAIQRPGTQAERAAAKQQRRIQGAELRAAAKKPEPKPSLWQKLTGGLKSKFAGVAGKLAKPFSKFAGAAIPGLGAAIGFADAQARSKSGDKLGAFLAGLSASLDAFTAAVAVAGLASAATGVGLPAAAVLATAATAAGAISMSIDVVLLIRDILKAFGVPVFNKGGRVVKRYQGGGTTRGGRPVGGPKRRAITPTRRKPPRITIPKTQPGKDVGGEKKIKEFYAKPEDPNKRYIRPPGGWLSTLFGEERKDLSAFETLKKMSGQLKNENTLARGVLGVISSGIDMALGQKPDKKVFRSLFDSIGYAADVLANQRMNRSMSSLMTQIRGFAEGGNVPPSRELKETYGSISTGDMIAKLIGPTIDQRVNEAIQSIEKQLQMKDAGGKKESPQDLDMTPGNIRVTSDSPDFWLLVTAALFENGIPTDNYQGAADAAQAIYNRVSLPGWPKSIRGVILQSGQFQPVSDYGGVGEWEKINSKESAIAFAKKYKGYSGNIVEKIAAALLNRTQQEKARTFVGPRDNFRSDSYEKSNNHLDDSTEVSRYGHTFGFEPRGANIGRFKKGRLMPAEVNKEIVTGKVDQLTKQGQSGYKPRSPGRFNIIQYITGDPSQGANYDLDGHGLQSNYHDHIAFKTEADKERAKKILRDAGIKIGSEYRPGDPGYHGANLAIDVPGYQWGGSGAIGQKEYEGSKKVRDVLGLQGGGLISPVKPNRPIPNSFASYETPGGGMMIAIQPMIIEKPVPVSGGGKMIAFPVPVAVNSNIDLSLSRG